MKITVEKRVGVSHTDYMAFINDDRRLWGCGRSPKAAIGDVVMHHSDALGFRFEYKGNGEYCDIETPIAIIRDIQTHYRKLGEALAANAGIIGLTIDGDTNGQ